MRACRQAARLYCVLLVTSRTFGSKTWCSSKPNNVGCTQKKLRPGTTEKNQNIWTQRFSIKCVHAGKQSAWIACYFTYFCLRKLGAQTQKQRVATSCSRYFCFHFEWITRNRVYFPATRSSSLARLFFTTKNKCQRGEFVVMCDVFQSSWFQLERS